MPLGPALSIPGLQPSGSRQFTLQSVLITQTPHLPICLLTKPSRARPSTSMQRGKKSESREACTPAGEPSTPTWRAPVLAPYLGRVFGVCAFGW